MMKYDYIYICNFLKYVQSIQVSEGIIYIYIYIDTFSNMYNLYKYIKDYKSIVNK